MPKPRTALVRTSEGALARLGGLPLAIAGVAGNVAAWLTAPRRHDAETQAEAPDADESARQLAFTFAAIGIAAKLTACDGQLSRDEFVAFREAFPLSDGESATLRELFALAWEDNATAEDFAGQVILLYPHRPQLWRELLEHLIRVARADGPLKPVELHLLTAVGEVFGFTRLQLGRLIASTDSKKADPARVLGLDRNATPAEIKAQYHALMRRYHPDAVASHVHYPEALAAAERRSASINQAYARLRKSA